MDSLIGQVFGGQYQILEEIGKGGMATVYRAVQSSIGREVAIKVLPRTFTHDATFMERFDREVQVIARLQHPHILPVHDYGQHNGQPYIVMAYINGGNLTDRIAQGPMSLDETIRIVRQAADALDNAHAEGIIHRDFKPSNILLDGRGNSYLADFGVAKVAESTAQLTGSGIVGTPSYMAPELAQPGGLTASVDVYALGVTIYQMLAGRAPYEADTPLGVLMAHVSSPIPDVREQRPDLPPTVQEVIQGAMAKTPEARYPTPGAVAHALEAAAAGKPLPTLVSMSAASLGAPTQSIRPEQTIPVSSPPTATPPPETYGAPRAKPSGSRQTLFLLTGMLGGAVVIAAIILLALGELGNLLTIGPADTATPTASPTPTVEPTEASSPTPTESPEPTATQEATQDGLTPTITATFQFTYTPGPGSAPQGAGTQGAGPTAEGGVRVEYQPYYYCRGLGNETFEWYGVNITYNEAGAVTNKEIVDGPHTGDWKPGCGAALPVEAYVEATSAVATLYSPDWQQATPAQ